MMRTLKSKVVEISFAADKLAAFTRQWVVFQNVSAMCSAVEKIDSILSQVWLRVLLLDGRMLFSLNVGGFHWLLRCYSIFFVRQFSIRRRKLWIYIELAIFICVFIMQVWKMVHSWVIFLLPFIKEYELVIFIYKKQCNKTMSFVWLSWGFRVSFVFILTAEN